LLYDKDQTKEDDEEFAFGELLLDKKLLVVSYNDLININKQEKIKLGSNVLVKIITMENQLLDLCFVLVSGEINT
jgi:hypothetical protein